MDLVYLLDSRTKDYQAFRLSFACAKKNLPHRKIFVIGKKPEDIEAIEIPFNDSGLPRVRGINTGNKLRIAIKNKDISDDFILMNDDFYAVKKLDKIATAHLGKLTGWLTENRAEEKGTAFTAPFWQRRIKDMSKLFPSGYFYEVHQPMIYNKKKLRETLKKRETLKPKRIYTTIRTMYGNYYNIGGRKTIDCKIYNNNDWGKLKHLSFLSTSPKIETEETFNKIKQLAGV